MRERQSNIELLRIIAMIGIVMHHFCVHGSFTFTPDITVNKIFLQFFSLFGKAGVAAFVIITGYFMINAKFKLHKFAKLVGQIWFYSLAMLGVALVLGLDTVTSTNIIKSLLPIGAMSWFGQNFLVLYLLTPFINPIIHRLQQNYLRLLLLIGLVIWFLTPTILNLFPQLPHTTFGFKHIFSFIYFYAIGAYIRLYGESITQKTGVIVTSIGLAGSTLGIILVDILAMINPIYVTQTLYFSLKDYGVFLLAIGLGAFILFLKSNIAYRSWINTVAATTFGIYLIHDNGLFARYMWDHIFYTYQYYDSLLLPIYAVCVVAIVFVVGMSIDYLRIQFLEKPLMQHITPILEQGQEWVQRHLD